MEFIIYLMMLQFHFYIFLFHVLYFMSILVGIFCSSLRIFLPIPLTRTTNLATEAKVSSIPLCDLLTCWEPCTKLQIVGLESIHHNWWNPPLCIQQQEDGVYLLVLWYSKYSFFKCPRISKNNHCPWVCSLIYFLNFPYLVL